METQNGIAMAGELYREKYRVHPHRRQGWDYATTGWYFITVNCYAGEMYFGRVEQGKMILSELGYAAATAWRAMERVYPVLVIDAWVIMPNHVHFLFAINNPEHRQYLPNAFQRMVPNSVSSIMNHFKGRITKYAKRESISFAWQPKFYDRIVRSREEFHNIRQYIIDNPQKWESDRFYTKK